ncbi:hypothetical protein Tco_0692053 [Tanacetum coccineum]
MFLKTASRRETCDGKTNERLFMLADNLCPKIPVQFVVELQGDNPRPTVINMFSSTVRGTGDQKRLVTREVKLLENAKAVTVSFEAVPEIGLQSSRRRGFGLDQGREHQFGTGSAAQQLRLRGMRRCPKPNRATRTAPDLSSRVRSVMDRRLSSQAATVEVVST